VHLKETCIGKSGLKTFFCIVTVCNINHIWLLLIILVVSDISP